MSDSTFPLTKNDILEAFSKYLSTDGRTGNLQTNLNVCVLFCLSNLSKVILIIKSINISFC